MTGGGACAKKERGRERVRGVRAGDGTLDLIGKRNVLEK